MTDPTKIIYDRIWQVRAIFAILVAMVPSMGRILLLVGFGLFWVSMGLSAETDKTFETERRQMVESQVMGRDVRDPKVLDAMRTVPRHLFVPERYQDRAYQDHPLPIGEGQTISQPYIVAKMTELAEVKKGSKVLEVGTGSGYQAAVLAQLGAEVYSIEILKALSSQAGKNLDRAGFSKSVHLWVGDGYRGWPDAKISPFDAVIVTAAPEHVPQPLIDQLKVNGRLVIPVGPSARLFAHQELLVITKTEKGTTKRNVFPVTFVPMTGEAEQK